MQSAATCLDAFGDDEQVTIVQFPTWEEKEWKLLEARNPLAQLMPMGAGNMDPCVRELMIMESLQALTKALPAKPLIALRISILRDAHQYGWFLSRHFFAKFLETAKPIESEEKETVADQWKALQSSKKKKSVATTKTSTVKKKPVKKGRDTGKMDTSKG